MRVVSVLPRVAAAEEAEFRPFVVPALASSEAESVGGGRRTRPGGGGQTTRGFRGVSS